jgi:hypothetical protein
VLFAQKAQANKAGCETSHGKKQRHVTLNTIKKKNKKGEICGRLSVATAHS